MGKLLTILDTLLAFLAGLVPGAMGAAVSLAYEKGLTWSDRFIQFTVGTVVSYFARGAIVALFDLHTFVIDGIVFTAGMIAFRATPRFASAAIDVVVGLPAIIRDRFVGGGR
ncbi:hypothetical protein ASE70_05680 [Sphingomonas sp. Leaf22]|uniref:hypothetical protein n=1 Tax=Sphingomonas sp. Leaf22 TaxID=1735687 RepID=UPI0006FA2008|nr:hypothetical protein [Sphingomonas sp. Leaf22]KQM79358.1 hypothetical protein ASE70_05680 [Sphingomonas sp. Leaf22]